MSNNIDFLSSDKLADAMSFLNALSKNKSVNMSGAETAIMDKFNLTKSQAMMVLAHWMHVFGDAG